MEDKSGVIYDGERLQFHQLGSIIHHCCDKMIGLVSELCLGWLPNFRKVFQDFEKKDMANVNNRTVGYSSIPDNSSILLQRIFDNPEYMGIFSFFTFFQIKIMK